ncbi:MAG: hypothetical protein LBC35_01390 [Coriobacteriales bacterium]|jgi:chaperonin cofactor prefoldin|nr:hypothetical protein [Coriobacteriales bacterium]
MNNIKTYEKMTDELYANDDRSEYVDTTNEPEFLAIRIAALKQQRQTIDKEIEGMEKLIDRAYA